MRNKSIQKKGAIQPNTHISTAFNSKPPNSNGYSLSTEQLHSLLSGDHINTCENTFDKAVLKQQQLLTICNVLHHQNSLHKDLELLLTSTNGIDWIDAQINEFKANCHPDLLVKLSHPAQTDTQKIENSQIINQHFFSLINERLCIPLSILSKLDPKKMNERERTEWYEWCLEFDITLEKIKQYVNSAQQFFSIKTFDKISNLAKDTGIQQHLGNIKHLFQSNANLAHDVESL